MPDYYKEEFKQKVQIQVCEEYPAEEYGEKEWEFRHARHKILEDILDGKFQIEEGHIISTQHGKIPLDNMPRPEYIWHKLPKQEVIGVNLKTLQVWLVSKKKRKYPVELADEIKDYELLLKLHEQVKAGKLIWAYINPNNNFEIHGLQEEEEETEEIEPEGTMMIVG